ALSTALWGSSILTFRHDSSLVTNRFLYNETVTQLTLGFNLTHIREVKYHELITTGHRMVSHLRNRPAPTGTLMPKSPGPSRRGPVTSNKSAGGAQPASPDRRTIRRWQLDLANGRLEERVYRDLAERRSGEDREILLALATAESRHQEHWISLLGEHADKRRSADLVTRCLAFLGRMFGSVFVLALAQQSETSSPYEDDEAASAEMAADERIHAEVVRALAARSRARLSGNCRAAVFGANDGLVSNLALVLGVGAAGVSNSVILLTGVSGLLAGALSMGAGEYISVRSQRELLEAST